ncbi:MAG TPA: hypothetical protein VFZ37_03835 [Jiangellaceae bacterium]
MTTAVARPELKAVDRCDSCGAQAYVRAVMPGESELLFCAHHGRRHEAKLRPLTIAWDDQTEKLYKEQASVPDDDR